jgi:hypothetical protein
MGSIQVFLVTFSTVVAFSDGKIGDRSELASLLLSRDVRDFNYKSPSVANLPLPNHTV